MSTLLTIILVLNLCFAGGTILVILYGMYMEKTRGILDRTGYHSGYNWKSQIGLKTMDKTKDRNPVKGVEC